MTAHLIDGKAIAAARQAELAGRISRFKARYGTAPGLAVVLVGNNEASQIYVRSKARATEQVGMRSLQQDLPATTSVAEVLKLITRLNADDSIDGILVQLPLPGSIPADDVIDALDPNKDVDGLHVMNTGRLAAGRPALVPCTALGCEILLRSVQPNLAGTNAVIVGRSPLVGRPLAHLLLRADCTVTVAHSRSRDLPALCRAADVLVVAVGHAETVRGEWIRPGAIVIDVGINRVTGPDGKPRLVGDVAFAEASARAAAITPVPGGVGPMTISCLLENVFTAACRRRGIDPGTV